MREIEGREVMIVEDDGSFREALSDVLASEGYSVLGATNGREALDRLRGREALPGLVIVDLAMPVMDGHAFCAELMRDPELSGIPLVIISGDPYMGERAGDLEAAAYLAKPIDMGRLLDTIKEHCPSC